MLLFWNLRFLDKLSHCFMQIKFAFNIIVIVTDILIVSELYNQSELTELHQRTMVTSFLLLLIGKEKMGKLK